MNFESAPNPEKEDAEYLEKLREAIEEGRPLADTPEAEQYIAQLDRELDAAEADWEAL